MRWIVIAVAVALACCSCVTVDGLALDMRISEHTTDMHHPSDTVVMEEPIIGCEDKREDIILLTGLPEAPFLPPTTLEEETYSGRTRFLNRAVSTPSSAPDGLVPPQKGEDGRGSALIAEPNYYVELGDDWDNSGWSDEPFRPTEPGTYRVYGW